MRAILCAFLFLAACFAGPVAAQNVYAITEVTVVPMDSERLVPGQTVIVRDGRIAAIGPSAETPVPEGVETIEGRGRYLMPGLAEMHAHVPPDPEAVQWTEDVLFLYAANGITLVRSMLGAAHHLELRRQAERGEIISPRIFASGPSFSGNSVASPEAARRMVREQKAAGYDILKIHPGLDRARYDAVAATAREQGIPFAGHVPAAVGLTRALEAGQATVDHLDGYFALLAVGGDGVAEDGGFFGFDLVDRVAEGRIAQVARRTREAGVWNVPTESLMRHLMDPDLSTDELLARDEMRYVPPDMRDEWKRIRIEIQGAPDYTAAKARRMIKLRRRVIGELDAAGAGLLLGSDAPQWFNVPGFSLLRELQYMVDSGLTPYEALAAGTVNVARYLGKAEEFGTIQPGRRADLLLLNANPLEDVANVRRRAGVMLGGRWFTEERLREGLETIAQRHAG